MRQSNPLWCGQDGGLRPGRGSQRRGDLHAEGLAGLAVLRQQHDGRGLLQEGPHRRGTLRRHGQCLERVVDY